MREEALEIHEKLNKLTSQISNDLTAQTETVVHLKNHIKGLHVALGRDDNTAWFETLCAAREWTHLDPFVRAIMAAGPQSTKIVAEHGRLVHKDLDGKSFKIDGQTGTVQSKTS